MKSTKIDYIQTSDSKITDDQDIAEALATNYEEIHKTTKLITEESTEILVRNSISSLNDNQHEDDGEAEILYTNKTEVTSIIKKTKK